jgi:hypothetical protein
MPVDDNAAMRSLIMLAAAAALYLSGRFVLVAIVLVFISATDIGRHRRQRVRSWQ